MYQKILVALDRSDSGENVFNQGLSLAKLYSANLMLVHVLSPEENNSPMIIPPDLSDIYLSAGSQLSLEEWRQQWELFERQGLELLQSKAETAISEGVKTEFHQITGTPGKTICQLARDWQVDLVVVGRRGLAGISELVLGSVSNYILHHAPCSVLIVQQAR